MSEDFAFTLLLAVSLIVGFIVGFVVGYAVGNIYDNSKLELVLQELNRAHPMVIDYMMEERPSHNMKEWFYTIATPDDL